MTSAKLSPGAWTPTRPHPGGEEGAIDDPLRARPGGPRVTYRGGSTPWRPPPSMHGPRDGFVAARGAAHPTSSIPGRPITVALPVAPPRYRLLIRAPLTEQGGIQLGSALRNARAQASTTGAIGFSRT